MLLEDYIAQAQGLGMFELLRQRLVREIVVAPPAAGAEWSQTVPPGAAWEPLSILEAFTTSAVVANRTPRIRVSDPDGGLVSRVASTIVQAASGTNRYTFLPTVTASVTANAATIVLPLPAVLIPSGWVIASDTSTIDVGDQYTGVILVVREWSVPAVQAAAEKLCKQLR